MAITCPAPLPPLGSEKYGYYGSYSNRDALRYTDLDELCADQMQFYTSKDWDQRIVNMRDSGFHNFGGRCVNGKVKLVDRPDWEVSQRRVGANLRNIYIRLQLLTIYHDFINTWDYCDAKCHCLDVWQEQVEAERRKGFPQLLPNLKNGGSLSKEEDAGPFRAAWEISTEAVWSPYNKECNGRCKSMLDCQDSTMDPKCGGDRVCMPGNGNTPMPLGRLLGGLANCISVSSLLGKRDVEQAVPRESWKCMCNETYIANACCWQKDGIVQGEMEIPM